MVKGAAAMVPSLGRSKDLESLRTPLLSAGSERSETSRSSPGGSPDAKTEKQIAKMRTAMADLVYPGRKTPEERAGALLLLEAQLAAKAPAELAKWWAHEPEDDGLLEEPLTPATVTPSDSATTLSAIKVQAAFRGLAARKHVHMNTDDPSPVEADPPKWWKKTYVLIAAAVAIGLLLLSGLIFVPPFRSLLFGLLEFLLVTTWLALYYSILIVVVLYLWLRLPRLLGYLFEKLMTPFVLFGIPIGFETCRFRLWLTYRPLTIHLDVLVSKFFMGNATHIACRDPDMVSAQSVQILARVDLGFVVDLINGLIKEKKLILPDAKRPIIIDIPTFIVSDVAFNMMLGDSGIFNLHAIATTINEGEIRRSLGETEATKPMPNVVRVKILAARKLLDLPNLKPRIEVCVRKAKVSTAVGRRATDSHHATVYHFHGAVVTLPTPNLEAVLLVRVMNDNVGIGKAPKLIGQWFMTLKWLYMCPQHCKHSKLHATGDGGITGTFLLTNAKLQGAACRGIGPHDLGHGFSGELDMAVQWTHTDLLDPPTNWQMTASPHAGGRLTGPSKSPLEQLDSTGGDDGLRFGNWAEFKAFLHNIPIRINTDHFVLRRVTIEMSDLFVGAGKGVDGARNAYIKELSFSRFKEVSLYSFFEVFALAVIKRVSLDFSALYTTTMEIFSGLGTNMGKQVYTGLKTVGMGGVASATVAAGAATARAAGDVRKGAATKIQAMLRGKKARQASSKKLDEQVRLRYSQATARD